MRHTRCGRTVPRLKHGPSQRRFVQRTQELVATRRFISGTRSSRGLRQFRRCETAGARWRDPCVERRMRADHFLRSHHFNRDTSEGARRASTSFPYS